MRIVLLAPWFRSLAQLHGRALQAAGHEVLVVTTESHFEPGYGFVPEVMVPAEVRTARWLPALRTARGAMRAFRPDHVLLDDTWDFRFASLTRGYSWSLVVHDAQPHDATHAQRSWRAWTPALLKRRAPRVFCFSQYVQAQLVQSCPYLEIVVLPLTSEIPDEWVSSPEPERRDFVLFGRMAPYKNVPVVLDAWRRFKELSPNASDRLLLLGKGEVPSPLPRDCTWENRRFEFQEAMPRMAKAKASICLYDETSQSGVQVTSMQLGVVPVVSNRGGLCEYQLPGWPVVDASDGGGLASVLLELSQGDRAVRLGAEARGAYEDRFSVERLGEALLANIEAGNS